MELYPLFTNQLNTNNITKMDPKYIKSPLFSIAFYGGAAVSFWAECLPEVQTLEQEVQGIQGEETVGQTSLREEYCYRLPTADTSPALWSLMTLPRKVGGNEQPQCHPGIERLLCHSSGNERHPGLASNERPGSPDNRS